MKTFRQSMFVFLLVCGPLFAASAAQPTFEDLAVLLAKGYFKKNISADAGVKQCVAFLNKQGVCFSLFDLMDPAAVVSREDFAKAVGQSTLLFRGEAKRVGGCIAKPDGIETWVDYCLLNDVSSGNRWTQFLKRTETGPPEEEQ